MIERVNDFQPDFLLHLLHATNVAEIDFGPLDLPGRGCRGILLGSPHPAIHHFAVRRLGSDPQAAREFRIRPRMIQLNRALVFGHRLANFTNASQNPGMQ